MSEDALWLDGNAIAGVLGDAFGADMTATPRRCQSCGRVNPVGAHRVYRGAGIAVRCPACGDVAMRIATLRDGYVVQMSGTWTLELTRP